MRPIATAVLGILAAASTSAAATIPSGTDNAQDELACIIMAGNRAAAAERSSPLDSTSFAIQGGAVKICYGRPSARGRTIFGGLLPYGELWRTGANEPTMVHTSVGLDIAGIQIEPGSYSLYTIPGESEWTVIVNASIEQWGRENRYTDEIRAKEVGRATVPSGATEDYVEEFVISAAETEDGGVAVTLAWERTKIDVLFSATQRSEE